MSESSTAPLLSWLPRPGEVTTETLLDGFLGYLDAVGIVPYPAQEEAILELFERNSVVLNTPTGSGKSLVALAAHFEAIATGGKSYYTAPIKALVSEKFFELCKVLGPENVGMMTGDASVNRDAPIICCTAEILSNLALREGASAKVDWVVMDEFHYYTDRDRGVAWQIPLLTLPHARFLLMSATLGETAWVVEAVTKLTNAKVSLVRSLDRPVPLEYQYRETPMHETLAELLSQERVPVYVVHFTQRAASERAQDLTSLDFLTKAQKLEIKSLLSGFRFDTPFGKDLKRWLHHGIGVHHAGMLPKYRLAVEKLAQSGLLKIVCGTDTLGVGVNIPIRTVLFTQLCKYDGDKTRILAVRDFHQIAGRAGRKGFDTRGYVLCQAPEHVVENRAMQGKAAGDPKKVRKLVLKKPPDRGYAHWDESTFERLRTSAPEKLVSRFNVSHGMLLNLLARGGREGCLATKQIIRASHETKVSQRKHARHAIAITRSLRNAGVIEPFDGGYRVNVDLQSDFSLNQALSLFIVEATLVLDRESPDFALDVLTLVEATLEDPTAVLMRQVDELKTRAIQRMKHEGVEYDERMAELEKIEYPKPQAALLWQLYESFRQKHAWVGGGALRPKSVARDMYEEGLGFLSYVKEYGLARSEGVLLRYLTDAYKGLDQSVPEGLRTPELEEVLDWLKTIVKTTDESLLAEWEKLKNPVPARAQAEAELITGTITDDPAAFAVLVRNEVFRVVRALAKKDYYLAVSLLDADPDVTPYTVERFAEELAPYFEEHGAIRTDPVARGAKYIEIERDATLWRVKQTLLDPEAHAEWFLDFDVDIDKSREEGNPVLRLGYLGT